MWLKPVLVLRQNTRIYSSVLSLQVIRYNKNRYNAHAFWIIPWSFSFPMAKYIWRPYFHLCFIVLNMVICCSFIVLSFRASPMLTSHSEMLHTSDSAVRRKHHYPRVFDDVQSPRSQWKTEENCLLLHLTTVKKNPNKLSSCLFLPSFSTLIHYAFFTEAEILNACMQTLTICCRLPWLREVEKGEFGFAPQIHFLILSYAKMYCEIADKYQLHYCKQKHTPLKLFLAVKLGERDEF